MIRQLAVLPKIARDHMFETNQKNSAVSKQDDRGPMVLFFFCCSF